MTLESAPSPASLEIYLLGLVEVDDVLRLQRRLVYDLGERDSRRGALILCEHPPCLTVGRTGSRRHIRPDDEELRSARIPMRWVNRGGGVILHLPGQLAAYLLLPLDALGLPLGGYLHTLHHVAIDLLAGFDLKATTRRDADGLFLGGERVGTVGVGVNRWITSHGLTLNVGPYLGGFALLDEPGPEGRPLRQTSMESIRQRPAPMHRVRETLIGHIERAFGLESHSLFTDHPLIRRQVAPHVLVASPSNTR
jgi:lipoyl(octanoyl) transferase